MHGIVLTAHRDDSGWTLQTFPNAFGDRGFPDTWWSSKQQYHTFLAINTFVFSYEFKDSLFSFTHSVVRVFKYFLRILDIPEWLYPFVPRKSKNLSEIVSFPACLHVVLRVKSIDFLLKHFSHTVRHVFYFI